MKNLFAVMAVTCATVVLAAGSARVQAAQAVTIEVSAPDRDYSDYPLTVEVDAPAAATAALLTDASGKPVLCQLSRQGGKAMLTLILPELKKGSSAVYKARFTDAKVAFGDGVKVNKLEESADVVIGGTLFTKYVFSGAEKPYLYPVIGPYGDNMTRHYPIKELPPEETGGIAEKRDHPHQRSAWFTHGDVNGTSYWHIGDDTGLQNHRGFDVVESGPVMGRITATIDWVKKGSNKKDCESVRDLRFYNVKNGRLFDWTEVVKATEGPVMFGDTKEGSFGFRIATTMRTDMKKGGRIVNSNGQTDGEAWGKAAAWCDYSGPVKGKTVGIAIFDHPTSFRHPTYWHVRTYGLFAANPFGLHDFVKELRKERKGEYKLAKGESTTFRYRVFIHKGTAGDAKVAEVYDQYANPPKVTVR